VIAGFVLLTVTVNMQVDPALDVQVTVVVPTGKNDPEAGEQVTVPQSPVVVGAEYVTTAPHCPGVLFTVTFAGQVRTQLLAALTVTVKMQVASGLLGLLSEAVQVTVVVPTGKVEPETGAQLKVAPGQLSDTVGSG
jgi:hypothetical protein